MSFATTKLCRGCNITQFYGYSKEGDKQGIMYDSDWKRRKYFLSSQETGFELSMLEKFDAELLIGIVSYKQKAEIYNVCNHYDTAKETKQQSQMIEDHTNSSKPSPEASTDLVEQCQYYYSTVTFNSCML